MMLAALTTERRDSFIYVCACLYASNSSSSCFLYCRLRTLPATCSQVSVSLPKPTGLLNSNSFHVGHRSMIYRLDALSPMQLVLTERRWRGRAGVQDGPGVQGHCRRGRGRALMAGATDSCLS
jgi:hypothetical protein